MNNDTTSTSGHKHSGPRLRNPGAQLLGFLGANMTVGSLAVLAVPLLIEQHVGASWNPVLAASQRFAALPAVVMCLVALAFIGGLVLMMLAVRRIRSSGR
jgi:hypothetical protein